MKNITISLVIPVFNENGRIVKTIKSLHTGSLPRGIKLCEVIFSDDGSTDGTVETLKKARINLQKKLHVPIKILRYTRNKGRGYAVRVASLIAKGDYIVYADADFSIPLTNLTTALPFIRKGTDVVFGSKKKPGAVELIERSLLRCLVGYGHSIIAGLILGVWAWDFQGGFKVFSQKYVQEVFPRLLIDRWGFDMEVVYLAKKLRGYGCVEIPVMWGHVERDSKVKLARDIYRAVHEMCAIRTNWFKGLYTNASLFPRFALNYKRMMK